MCAGFGEASPEAKGAKHLHNFFTYIAVGIDLLKVYSYLHETYIYWDNLKLNSIMTQFKFLPPYYIV